MNADLQDKEKFSCLKNRKKVWGMSFDLRISETICVLFKSWTQMNADLKDLVLKKNNKREEGW